MIEKLKAFYAVFTAGQMVANPTSWKKKQITGGLIAGFLGAAVSLSKVFGYDIPLSDEQLLQIGGAVIAVFGLFNGAATVVSTDKLGLQPRPDGQSDHIVQVDSAVLERVSAVSAQHSAALQPERHADAPTRFAGSAAEPEKPLRTFDSNSFTGGG